MRIIIALSLLLLLVFAASNVWADERVLTIYFHGTGFVLDEQFQDSGGYRDNVISVLYNNNGSKEISRKAYNDNSFSSDFGKWVPEPITDLDKHYRFNVNGAGTSATSSFLTIVQNFITDILGNIDPNLSMTRTWDQINEEALAALDEVHKAHSNDDVIVNLVGFSRGGVSALKFAHTASAYDWVKKINILNYDPVPGGLDPVSAHMNYFVLNAKVNEYVSLYAEGERSLQFEPILPRTLNSQTRRLFVRVAGSHETMIGNRQYDGHAMSIINKTEVPEFKVVSDLSIVTAEQLLSSDEWGNVPFTETTGVVTKEEFTALVDEMWTLDDLGRFDYMEGVYFTGFADNDLCFENRFAYELRSLLPNFIWDPLGSRLVFKGTERGAPGWQWGNCGLGYFFNAERVYWLNNEVSRISAATWDTLQGFRDPKPAALPNELTINSSSYNEVITDECYISISDLPTATGKYTLPTVLGGLILSIDPSIAGSSVDPLEYSEQGTYVLEWTWDYQPWDPFFPILDPQRQASITQTVFIDDTVPPQPEKATLTTVHDISSAEVTTVPNAVDNCSGLIPGTTSDPLIYTTEGTYEITWRYADGHGNSNTQAQQVVVHSVGDLDKADFNADGISDIIYQNSNDGRILLWCMENFTYSLHFPQSLAKTWTVAGKGDFNGDGTGDLLYVSNIGGTAIAEMGKAARSNLRFPGGINPIWSVQGVGDFNGDGTDDILWRRSTDHITMIWGMSNSGRAKISFPGGLASFWTVVGVGDFNDSGTDDVLYQNESDGSLLIWEMNNYVRTSLNFTSSLANTWAVVGIGDFNSDGTDDVLYRKDDGSTAIAEFANLNRSALKFPGGVKTLWSVQDVGDYNGDGTSDILLRRSTDNVTMIWGISKSLRSSIKFPGGLAAQWLVQ